MKKQKLENGKHIRNDACPNCGNKDSMGIFQRRDGSYYGKCFDIECTQPFIPDPLGENEAVENPVKVTTEKVYHNINELHPAELKSRGISLEIARSAGVRVVLNEDGEDEYHYYPYKYSDGSGGCFNRREVKNKNFLWIGRDKDRPLKFFNQDSCGEGGKMIIITEGVCDCLAAIQLLKEQGKNYRVVSVPDGAGNAVKSVQDNYEWLASFENIFLSFDMDVPGRKAADQVAELFPPNVVKIISLPDKYKDANDVLLAHKSKLYLEAIFSSKEVKPDGIIGVEDIFEEAIKPPVRGKSFPWPTLDKATFGYRADELWGIGAGCVDGDTEFLSPEGWIKIKDWNGEMVAQYDKGQMEFVEPLEYIKEECLLAYQLKYKRLTMVLSADHNLLFHDCYGNYQKVLLSDLLHFNPLILPEHRLAIDLAFKNGIDNIDEDWEYEDAIFLELCIRSLGYTENERIDTYGEIHTKLSVPTRSERQAYLFSKLLNQQNIEFYTTGQGKKLSFHFYYRPYKLIPKDWYSLDGVYLQRLAHAWVAFMGFKIKGTMRWQYKMENSKDLMDFLQFLCAGTGWRMHVFSTVDESGNLLQELHKFNGRHYKILSPFKISPYKMKDKFKYCFKVPSSNLILRRSGAIFSTGNSGAGKSEWFKEMIDHVINVHKEVAGVFFLEEPASKTLKVLAGKKANKRFHIPQEMGGDWQIDELVDGINELKGKVYLYNHFGAKDWESIKPKIRYMVNALGIKTIFLDHLTALVAQEANEYTALNKIMEELASLCSELSCTIFYISHLRKSSGVPHEEGGRVTADQFKGSGAIVFWSHFLIGLERNQQAEDEDTKNTTTMRVLKDRNTGLATGLTVELKYDHKTGRWGEKDFDEFDEEI